ncbi:hypothetical protein ABBQ38_004881 [Trebouxia sp. C0009 RCD-2024]
MYKAPGHALDSSKGQTKASLAAEKDEVAKRFAGALIIRTDGAIRAPVVTLQGEKANLYNVIEKHLRPEVVVGAERFWKLIRAMYSPNLDTWRPRVNGVQLKALQGARLPETDQEWHCVKVVLDTIADWIREDTTPEAFLQELKELVAYCESWWDNRTKREGGSGSMNHGGPGGHKRSLPSSALGASKRQNLNIFAPHGFPGSALVPDLVNQSHQMFASHQGDSLRELASVAVDNPMTSEGLVDPSGGGYMDLMTAEQAGHFLQSQANHQSSSLANGDLPHAHHAQATHNGHQVAAGLAQAPGQQALDHHPNLHHQSHEPGASTRHSPHGQMQHGQKIVTLNVGGRRFVTTAATLSSVEGSFLWKLVTAQQQSAAAPRASLSGEFFIDRNGKLFEYILEYLRTVRFGEPDHSLALPPEHTELAQIVREADFFGLPGLADKASAGLDADSTHGQGEGGAPSHAAPAGCQYDSVYLETGFHPVKSEFNVLQQQQAATMEELTREIQSRQANGFKVVKYTSGVAHDTSQVQAPLANLHFLVLLQKSSQ